MSGNLSEWERFLGRQSPDPATAAAVAVLSVRPAACSATSSVLARPPAHSAIPAPAPAHSVVSAPPVAGLAASARDSLSRGLAAVAPHLSDAEHAAWVAAMQEPLRAAAITAPRCVAAFLGQCAVESRGFLVLEENLSYSVERLCQVWPGRFPNTAAAAGCAYQPEILANQVYADRMGNGTVQSGDGWRFRGRGLIQLSGRANYQRFATAKDLPLDAVVRNAATAAGAAESAAWFWTTTGLNDLAAAWSIDLISRTINGGMSSASQRSQLCHAALNAIGV